MVDDFGRNSLCFGLAVFDIVCMREAVDDCAWLFDFRFCLACVCNIADWALSRMIAGRYRAVGVKTVMKTVMKSMGLLAITVGALAMLLFAVVSKEARADQHCEIKDVEVTTPLAVILSSLRQPNVAAERGIYWAYHLEKLKGEKIKTVPLGESDGVLFVSPGSDKVGDGGVVIGAGADKAGGAIDKMEGVKSLDETNNMFRVYLVTTRNKIKEVDYDLIVRGVGKNLGKERTSIPCDWGATQGVSVAQARLNVDE